MNKKAKAAFAVEYLKTRYPEAQCSLEAADPFRLLVAVRLSAQCTDARVNTVTPALFGKYPDAESMAAAEVEDIEEIIRPCGFFHTKAADLKAMSGIIVTVHGGKVPGTMEELTALPGVGRKTANLILGDVYGKPAVVCDTHVIRICGRLGLTSSKDPLKTETELRKLLDPKESNDFCHRMVQYGRDVCRARGPKCAECGLAEICPSFAGDGK